jgi:acyl-CoA oxidase
VGRTATHAIVYARLLTGEIDNGIHPFMLQVSLYMRLGSWQNSARQQIRDLRTHELVPGVVAGDIGPKMGCTCLKLLFSCKN